MKYLIALLEDDSVIRMRVLAHWLLEVEESGFLSSKLSMRVYASWCRPND